MTAPTARQPETLTAEEREAVCICGEFPSLHHDGVKAICIQHMAAVEAVLAARLADMTTRAEAAEAKVTAFERGEARDE